MALQAGGPESEAESVRFQWRRVTKVGPEVKHGRRRARGPLNKACERRTWALPRNSSHDFPSECFGFGLYDFALKYQLLMPIKAQGRNFGLPLACHF